MSFRGRIGSFSRFVHEKHTNFVWCIPEIVIILVINMNAQQKEALIVKNKVSCCSYMTIVTDDLGLGYLSNYVKLYLFLRNDVTLRINYYELINISWYLPDSVLKIHV